MHMPVFFFVAGLHSKKALSQPFLSMARKKAKRLLIPYLMWSLVAVAAKEVLRLMQGNFSLIDSVRLALHTLMFGDSVWFFLSLFLTFCTAWLLIYIYSKAMLPTIGIFLIILFLPLPSIFVLHKTQEMLFFFTIGMVWNKFGTVLQISRIRNTVWFPTMCVAVLFFFSLLTPQYELIRNSYYLHFAALLIIEFFVTVPLYELIKGVVERTKQRKWYFFFSILGRYSMQIYVIHMFFISYLPIRLPAEIAGSSQFISGIMYTILSGIICVLCVGLSKYVLDRIKLYRCLFLGKSN